MKHSIRAQHQQVNSALAEVLVLIETLPNSLSLGTPEGTIASNFSNFDIDEDEGPYFSVNQAWERTFQKAQEAAITRGPYGVKLVYDFFAHFLQIPGIEAHGGLDLMLMRVNQLGDMLRKVLSVAKSSTVTTQSSGLKIKLRGNGKQDPDADDTDYRLPRQDPPTSPIDLESDSNDVMEDQTDKTKKPKRKGAPLDSASGKKQRKVSDSGTSGSESESQGNLEKITKKGGRERKKGLWALSHFIASPATDKNGKPIWKWVCNWCPTYRTSPRTTKCVDYGNETLSQPTSSNFTSHLEKCKNLPSSKSFEAWCLQNNQTRSVSHDLKSTSPTPQSSSGTGSLAAQRNMMKGFIQRGIENPAKQLTVKGFREHLVKGIIEDNLPFTLVEKPGMKKTFTYILPYNYPLPGRQTIRRDLDLLHDATRKKLDDALQENPSKLAIATDLWTSRSSVYAFVGSVVFYIDNEWKLHEQVLDLQHLPGGHTGAASGKLIFQTLCKRRIQARLITNTTDNTSSNQLMNRAISKRLAKMSNRWINPINMQVGCAAHVLNLVSQAIFFNLGAAPDPDERDLFDEAKAFPLVYNPEEDEEVVEETKMMRAELQSGDMVHEGGELASDSSDDADSDGEDEILPSKKKSVTGAGLSAVQKLHAIVVDILRSDIRRKKMRKLIRQLCDEAYNHLVLVRGMEIRWNTTYAEIDRGIKLKPAVNHWVDQLDNGLRGKNKAAATRKKKKWHLSHSDWELLERLCVVLKDLYDATLDFSVSHVPTITKPLPLYKFIEQRLEKAISEIMDDDDPHNLKSALTAGLQKLRKHLKKAFESHYPLLGAVLHPSIRLAYFQDSSKWASDIPTRAEVLLEHLFDEYSADIGAESDSGPSRTVVPTAVEVPKSIFDQAITLGMTDSADTESATGVLKQSELASYLGGAYPCTNRNDPLGWWKTHASQFPVLSRVARDVLAIPGVSVSVERLFSSTKHTLSDSRSSMTADTASKTVVTKEWLKKGLGDGLTYLDNISIHHNH